MSQSTPELPVQLTKGTNVALQGLGDHLSSVTVVLETQSPAGRLVDGDVSILLLGANGRVRSSDDFIFYNQPVGLDGAIALQDKVLVDTDGEENAGQVTTSDTVILHLAAIPTDVVRVVVAASLDSLSKETFGDAARLTMRVQRTVDAVDLVTFEILDATTEAALLFGEFYRRGADWKLRAVGQGYEGGLADLARDHGVDVADSGAEPAGVTQHEESTNVPFAEELIHAPTDVSLGLSEQAPGDSSPSATPPPGVSVRPTAQRQRGSIHAYVVDGSRLRVTVKSDQGQTLALEGDLTDLEPRVESGGVLESNHALVSNMWAYAKTWHEANGPSQLNLLSLRDPDEQRAALRSAAERKKAAAKRSAAYARVAQWIADVADDVSSVDPKQAWCSSCYFKTEHRRSNRPAGQLPVYVCQGCGTPTLTCAAPRCTHMAVRDRGVVRVPQYCAEHRHEIPGFQKALERMDELHDYEQFLKFEKPDLSSAVKIATVGVVGLTAAAPLALLAAPAIGGAIGSMGIFGGLSGAAASAHGLALLGGGSIAAGGLGMAGGTTVVTAVGAAVGGTLGASVSNAYLREDKSFRIELLRPGRGGVPVVVANGFLTQGDNERWGGWRAIVDAKYPDSPVYRVRWGSKEIKDLGSLVAGVGGRTAGVAAITGAAATATKAGAKLLGRAVAPLVAADLVKNPWHVAKNRADKTGVILGDLVARTNTDSYVFIGHSLGARVMVVAAETLGTKPNGPRLRAVHLLGAAIRAQNKQASWDALTAAVDDAVYGYHSANDDVLKLVYKAVQGGQSAAGCNGFRPTSTKLVNVDVSQVVKSHFDYQGNVELQ